jgi:hypothetical protein
MGYRASRVDVKKLEKQEAKLRVRTVKSSYVPDVDLCPCVLGQDRQKVEA